MCNELIERIREYVTSQQHRPIPFGPATPENIEDAEAALGFPIPEILKLLYLQVGNGGFGPGKGGKIIGVKGGYASPWQFTPRFVRSILAARQAIRGRRHPPGGSYGLERAMAKQYRSGRCRDLGVAFENGNTSAKI